MTDKPFFPQPDESAEEWHTRLRMMDPADLTCLQRQRRPIWLEIARAAVQKERRQEQVSRRKRDTA